MAQPSQGTCPFCLWLLCPVWEQVLGAGIAEQHLCTRRSLVEPAWKPGTPVPVQPWGQARNKLGSTSLQSCPQLCQLPGAALEQSELHLSRCWLSLGLFPSQLDIFPV